MEECRICNNKDFISIYNGSIRAGTYGKVTEKNYKVIQCTNCKFAWLDPLPTINYQESEYRINYTGTAESDDYIEMFDHEQTPRIGRIGIEKFRDKVVADLGCGGGSFLDTVKGVAKKTIAIEPYAGYHESLRKRGHSVYAFPKDALEENSAVDVVISFGVIEHTDNPVEYISEAYSLLKDGGEIFIETDNLNDFLMLADIDEFKEFFYRTAHYWYFSGDSLTALLKKIGFRDVKPGYRHNYDLSNSMCWMRDRKPTGLKKIDWLNKMCDKVWVEFLEQNAFADLLHFSAKK